MKNQFAIIFGTLSVLILMGVFIVAYLFVQRPGIIALQQKVKAHHEVVVMDFDGNGITNIYTLVSGNDAIIAVSSPDKKNQAGLFNSTSGLIGLRLKQDWLTTQDPAYHMLMLVFITKGGKHYYESLAEAGIQAIRIDTKRLKGGLFSEDIPGNSHQVGEAIMKNGKHNSIHLIAVE